MLKRFHICRAFCFSLKGIKVVFKNEIAFRQEVYLTLPIILIALWLGHSALHRAILIAVWLLVPRVELLNSALEAVVDLASPEQHELAGRAKDAGSAAVLIAILIAIIVWLSILL